MKEEKLLDLLENIDEKYILETERRRSRRNFSIIRKASLIAACISLLILSTFVIHLIGNNDTTVNTPTTETTADDITQEDALPPSTNTTDENTDDSDIDEELSGSVGGSSSSGGAISPDGELIAFMIGTVESFTENGFLLKKDNSDSLVNVTADNTVNISVGDRICVYYSIPQIESSEINSITAIKITKE